jgi:hypothetical protein
VKLDPDVERVLRHLGDGATVNHARIVLELIKENRTAVLPIVEDHVTRLLESLAGVAELAERYGVSRQAVSNWAHRGMPSPVLTLASGPVYDVRQVDAWRVMKSHQNGAVNPDGA